jgi:hypothetical protein
MAYLVEIRNTPGRTANNAPMLDEVRGVIFDVLAFDGLGLDRRIELIRHRAADATTEQLLRAAILVLGEQKNRMGEIVAQIGDLGDEVARLEDEAEDREAELEALRSRPRTPA